VTGLVVAPDRDHPEETDAGEFQRQAKRIALLHAGDVLTFDNEAPYVNRGAAVLNALAELPPASLSWFATCCHGWPLGVQAGFDLRGGPHGLLVSQLVIALARVAKPGAPLIVPLYSCSTAKDPLHGFAAALSRGLAQAGVTHRLYAHTGAGHCTRWPEVRWWDGEAVEGAWLVQPHGPTWPRWVHLLHDGGTLDVTYPWMLPEELAAVLG
jgi:hypothetical protein